MPREFSNTVRVYSLNREDVINKLTDLARLLIAKNQNVLKVILFGSLAENSYSPHSDADIVIILKEDNRRRMDRIPEFLIHFLPAGIGVDIFPFTLQEMEDNLNENPSWRRILKNSITLAKREDVNMF